MRILEILYKSFAPLNEVVRVDLTPVRILSAERPMGHETAWRIRFIMTNNVGDSEQCSRVWAVTQAVTSIWPVIGPPGFLKRSLEGGREKTMTVENYQGY